ncbi:MAG: hypothetical protein AAF360_11010, partial [Pseudomonadota bacterium]
SLFKNKFIMRDGHGDLFRSYSGLVGEAPETTTFRRFVTKYLRPDFRALDLHVLPQSRHLKRFRYTDPIPIRDLRRRMALIIGDDLAGRFFAKPVNSTTEGGLIDLPNAPDIEARDLALRFHSDGEMPSDQSLLDIDLRDRLQDLYASDLAMIEKIEAQASRAAA